MLAIIILAILVSLTMVLLRVVIGPSIFDRMLGVNSINTHLVVLIVLLGVLAGSEFFIDIAITYGFISFITPIAFLMYFKYRPDEE